MVRLTARDAASSRAPLPPSQSKGAAAVAQSHQDDAQSRSVLYCRGSLTFDGIWTANPAMQECLKKARRLAKSEFGLLILGETGTGKNLLAQAIHNAGPRSPFPFVEVDIASLAETVLPSELFGCVEGAFTGARDRAGFFRTAHRGTLFLDEIGNLNEHSQRSILSAVERKRVTPVGSSKAVECDVRLITATNMDVARARRDGRFRDDLYYRIARTELHLPPLRERPEDIELLGQRFLELASVAAGRRVKGFSNECLERMRQYHWPGNVRELRSLIDRAMIDCGGDTLEAEHLFAAAPAPPPDEQDGDEPQGPPASQDWSLKAAERRHILKVLNYTGWNRARAARLLGLSRATLYQKLSDYALSPPSQAP